MSKKLDNKRLLACARLMSEFPKPNRCAADIGTDHGYLAAYLIESEICQSAIASDINPMPLASAERTVKAHGLSDRVALILSDGLDSVPRGNITDIICAGMGGELIADIISRCGWARECTLFLQPMSKAEELRRSLYDNDFAIVREIAQRDGRFVYPIICVEYSPQLKSAKPLTQTRLRDRYLYAGLIDPCEADGAEYIKITAERLDRAARAMLAADPDSAEGSRRLAAARTLFEELQTSGG